MMTSQFRVVPIAPEVAEAARRDAANGAPDHRIVTVDSATGYPCRQCLQFAKPGEEVVLFPFASIPPGHPYSETGPVFVHQRQCSPYCDSTNLPAQLRRGRVIRAYNSNYDMIDAQVADQVDPESIIATLLQNPATAFLQARSVSRGCYTFSIQRA